MITSISASKPMDNRRRECPQGGRCAHADAVQRPAPEALTRGVPLGLGVHHHHDRLCVYQRVPHEYRHDQFYQVRIF